MKNLEFRLNEMLIDGVSDGQSNENKWGWPLKDLFRQGLSFYKEHSGRAFQFSYEDNLKLVAFTQQAVHGPVADTAMPIGTFDVIGRDRRIAWQHLGNITKSQAMEGFVDLLDRLCPIFRPYIAAIQNDKEEKMRMAIVEERQRQEQLELERQRDINQKLIEVQQSHEEMQKRKLQDALNQQTYIQFRVYAEKQYPGNPEQQGTLIRQLQTEHYHQYMQQLHAQIPTEKNEKQTKSENGATLDGMGNNGVSSDANRSVCGALWSKENCSGQMDNKGVCESDDESSDGFPSISPPNMWTKPNIEQFKVEVAAGKGEGIIKVGHGDIVTVRVPTHEGGSCLYWEFATDNFDIGFGVFFQWGKSASNEVTIQVCDDSESGDVNDDENEDYEISTNNDLEMGVNEPGNSKSPSTRLRPAVSSVVPVYRRDCQSEVYAGTHTYPGEGVYLLKFDNSYSLWRSKTLYYRVFYTR